MLPTCTCHNNITVNTSPSHHSTFTVNMFPNRHNYIIVITVILLIFMFTVSGHICTVYNVPVISIIYRRVQ